MSFYLIPYVCGTVNYNLTVEKHKVPTFVIHVVFYLYSLNNVYSTNI